MNQNATATNKTALTDEVFTEVRMAALNAVEPMFSKMDNRKMMDTYSVADEVLRGVVQHGMTTYYDPSNPNPKRVLDLYVSLDATYTIAEIAKVATRIASFHIPTHYASTGGARERAAHEIATAVIVSLFGKSEIIWKH